MNKFRYPLERLKQIRERELMNVADELRHINAEMQKVKNNIATKFSAIQVAQQLLVDTEEKTGTVRTDLRKMSALYVQSVRSECDELDKLFMELQQKQIQTHGRLVEKKQSVKMLDNHESRLSSYYQLALQKFEQKEDDDLWLTRYKN